jgi:hypothetical protein
MPGIRGRGERLSVRWFGFHICPDSSTDSTTEIYECQKAILTTIHFTEKDKKFWLGYCDAMSNPNRTGSIPDDLRNVRAVKVVVVDLS